MEKRVVFQDKSSRNLFFKEALKLSGFKTLKELRIHTKIPKSIFEYYRNGGYTLPFGRYLVLKSFLLSDRQDYFNNK